MLGWDYFPFWHPFPNPDFKVLKKIALCALLRHLTVPVPGQSCLHCPGEAGKERLWPEHFPAAACPLPLGPQGFAEGSSGISLLQKKLTLS